MPAPYSESVERAGAAAADSRIIPKKRAADTRGEVISFCGTFFLFSLAVYAFVVSVARLHERSSDRGT